MFRIIVRIQKASPNHFVALERRASRDLFLFFDRYVSLPPAIAPERPAVLPLWRRTMVMIITQIIS